MPNSPTKHHNTIMFITDCYWVDFETLKALGSQIATVSCVVVSTTEKADWDISNYDSPMKKHFDIVVHNRVEMETAVICALKV
jgi:hypothetical protein